MRGPAPGFKKIPTHKVELSAPDQMFRVELAGTVVGETTVAIRVDEDGYPPRYYVPRDDIEMSRLSPTDRTSHCPFKGDARYWTVTANERVVENGAWGYDQPYDECSALAGHVAFYGDSFRFSCE